MKLSEIKGKTFVLRALAPKSIRVSIVESFKTIVFQVEKEDGGLDYVGAFCDQEYNFGGTDLYFATYLGLEGDVAKLPRLGIVSFGEFTPL